MIQKNKVKEVKKIMGERATIGKILEFLVLNRKKYKFSLEEIRLTLINEPFNKTSLTYNYYARQFFKTFFDAVKFANFGVYFSNDDELILNKDHPKVKEWLIQAEIRDLKELEEQIEKPKTEEQKINDINKQTVV